MSTGSDEPESEAEVIPMGTKSRPKKKDGVQVAAAKAVERARKAAPRVESPSKNLVFSEGEFDEPEPGPTVAGLWGAGPSGTGPSGSRRNSEREAMLELG